LPDNYYFDILGVDSILRRSNHNAMADRNQLANEKKALLDEATVIENNAKSQIEAIQKEAQEQLKPKHERIIAINDELLKSIDEEAGIVND